MTQQSLEKMINLQGLSLALAKVKADYIARIQRVQDDARLFIINVSEDEQAPGTYGDDQGGYSIWWAIEEGRVVCVKYLNRFYLLEMDEGAKKTFVSYYTNTASNGKFTQLWRSEFAITVQNYNYTWTLTETCLDLSDAAGSPEVFIGSTTPSGYTLYIDPDGAITQGEGVDF